MEPMIQRRFCQHTNRLVRPKKRVPADNRGHWLEAGTVLRVSRTYGQHLDLDWPEGGPAASQVHYSKLVTAQNVKHDQQPAAASGT